VSDSLDLLLAEPGDAGQDETRTPTILASEELDPAHWTCPASRVVPDEELARTLRHWSGAVRVVATPHVGPTLLRALREHPPQLLIITGDLSPNQAADLQSIGQGHDAPTYVLGPRASLHVGDDGPLACAGERSELAALVDALGGARIALCPSPGWLPSWLESSTMESFDLVGYVDWEVLDLRWTRWAQCSDSRNVVVPLGVESPSTERALHPALDRATATHALEAMTGPIYPAPRVLATVHRGPSPANDALDTAPAPGRLWSQARRALPRIGGLVGMDAPLPGLDVSTPTAAFLGQRVLLHMERARECLERSPELAEAGSEASEESARERARAVLTGSGEVLSEHESKVVLRGYDIEITRQAVASSASGAANFADRIGYPVVLKAVSPDLRRKAELGAVKLALSNAAAVKRGYASIVHAVEENAPTARLDGVAVAEMVEHGQEIHCGGLRMQSGDIAFHGRPVGLDTPVDPCFCLASSDPAQAMLFAHAILSRLPVPARRRASDPSVQTLAALFLRLHTLFADTGDRLLSVELSPLRLVSSERGYVTLDARIVQRAHLEGE
jgi:acetyltransferase